MTLATGVRGQAQTRREGRLGDTAKQWLFTKVRKHMVLKSTQTKRKFSQVREQKSRLRKTEMGEMQYEILSLEGKSKVIGGDDHNRGPGNHRGATQDPIGSDVLGPRSQNIDKS